MSKKKNPAAYRAWMNDRVYVEPKMLQSHMLVLDEEYQRKVDMKRVDRIVANFNPYVVNPLKVNHRDGKYYVFNGGHTLMALKKIKGQHGSFLVECRVYENMTKDEEKLTFAVQDGDSAPISVNDEMNALAGGNDPETLDLIEVTEDSGTSLSIRGKKDHSIKAIGKARTIYRKFGGDAYSETLSLIMDTWNGENGSLAGNMMGGVTAFLNAFGDEYKRDRFIRKLKVKNPKDLLTSARLHKTAYQTLDSACATEIANAYNYGGGNGRLKTTIVV